MLACQILPHILPHILTWIELDSKRQKNHLLSLKSLYSLGYRPDKNNKKLHGARKEIYVALSKEQDSSMARNIFNHANLASNELKRDLASED